MVDGTRGRANGRIDVEIGQPNALTGELVNVRCFDKGISKAARICKSHVVDKDDQDVWFLDSGTVCQTGLEICQEDQ